MCSHSPSHVTAPYVTDFWRQTHKQTDRGHEICIDPPQGVEGERVETVAEESRTILGDGPVLGIAEAWSELVPCRNTTSRYITVRIYTV